MIQLLNGHADSPSSGHLDRNGKLPALSLTAEKGLEQALERAAYGCRLEQALVALANHCDGATDRDATGFSKLDATWFAPHVLTARDGGRVAAALRGKVLSRLDKYASQLSRHGLNINDLHTEEDSFRLTRCKADNEPTQADRLLELAEKWELFTWEGLPYASFSVESRDGDRRGETHPFSRNGVRAQLVYAYLKETGSPPSSEAVSRAMSALEARAQYEGREQQVWLRLGRFEDKFYYDLNNAKGEVVEISKTGWRLQTDSPVRFLRTRHMKSQVTPVQGGSVDTLKSFVNLDESGWRLAVSWILHGFDPESPHAILLIEGQQGSAKSTLARIIRRILDPHSAPMRAKPKDDETLAIQAKNNAVVILDNLADGLQDWLSDALCGLSTGSGFGARQHYSNDEESCFNFCRPVVLNGLGLLSGKPDLGDRLLRLIQNRIPDEKRLAEQTFWDRFDLALPQVLGGFFDVLVVALENKGQVPLPPLPRMADFCKLIVEAEEALPWPAGGFLEAFLDHRSEQIEATMEGDPLATAVRDLVVMHGHWEGPSTELLERLDKLAIGKDKRWPRSSSHLGHRLSVLGPFLQQVGIKAEPRKSGSRRYWVLEKIGTSSRTGVDSSA